MIFDRTSLLSAAQAITADAPSTDAIELRAVAGTVFGASSALPRDVGKGERVPLGILVVEAFNNLTSLRVIVQTADEPTFATPRNLVETVIPIARLSAGSTASIDAVPPGSGAKYLRLFYDITGAAPTTGRVTAGVVAGLYS